MVKVAVVATGLQCCDERPIIFIGLIAGPLLDFNVTILSPAPPPPLRVKQGDSLVCFYSHTFK